MFLNYYFETQSKSNLKIGSGSGRYCAPYTTNKKWLSDGFFFYSYRSRKKCTENYIIYKLLNTFLVDTDRQTNVRAAAKKKNKFTYAFAIFIFVTCLITYFTFRLNNYIVILLNMACRRSVYVHVYMEKTTHYIILLLYIKLAQN